MPDFMALEEFLLLRDPDDIRMGGNHAKYARSYHRCGELLEENYNSRDIAKDLVDRYHLAKASWEKYGDDGPPIGTRVKLLTGSSTRFEITGYDGCPGHPDCWVRLKTVGHKAGDRDSIVTRTHWYVRMRVVE